MEIVVKPTKLFLRLNNEEYRLKNNFWYNKKNIEVEGKKFLIEKSDKSMIKTGGIMNVLVEGKLKAEIKANYGLGYEFLLISDFVSDDLLLKVDSNLLKRHYSLINEDEQEVFRVDKKNKLFVSTHKYVISKSDLSTEDELVVMVSMMYLISRRQQGGM